jgi:hypothetical protein
MDAVVRPDDPILARREAARRAATAGQRIGYACFAAAIVLFAVGVAIGFPGWTTVTLTVLLGAGSVILAPAIVLGYAVKAADREDRERGGHSGSA